MPTEEAVPVALARERLGVLGVGVRDSIDVGPQRLDRVDPEPQQMRRVEVQIEAKPEHPFPQLGRVREVAGVAVRMPPFHGAVLNHQPHAALACVVDQRRKHAFGLTEILGHAESGVAADERADGDAAERGRRVDARPQMRVVGRRAQKRPVARLLS